MLPTPLAAVPRAPSDRLRASFALLAFLLGHRRHFLQAAGHFFQ